MTAFVACRGHRPLLFPVLGSSRSLSLQSASRSRRLPPIRCRRAPSAGRSRFVSIRPSLLKLPERTTTLVIGNPLIADASVQPGGVVVITAKSYGMTNLVALDRAGDTLAEYPIQVIGPGDATVVIYRGIERETYSCATICEKRITLGDSAPIFGANLNALGTFSAQCAGEQKK